MTPMTTGSHDRPVPKDLAALLVEEAVVSAEVMDRALARQQTEGGTLDTALLELGAVAEETLGAYLSRAAELPAAPPTAWTAADARARRVFPSRVAERHGLAPFALEGRELALVVTHPLDLALLDEISFMLSLHLAPHVGPEWRVRELIQRLYGSALSPRLAALAAADGGPVAELAAPDDAGPRAPAAHEAASPAPAPPDDDAAAAEAPDRPGEPGDASFADELPQAHAPSLPPTAGFARDTSEPLEPLAAALAQAIEAVEPELLDGDLGEAEPPADDEPRAPPDRTAPPRWSVADARAALSGARDRDEVVLIALRYARDFFQFAAVFAVTRDAVAGHDALGPEDARDRCRATAIYASDPGIVRTVIETRSPYLGPVAHDAAGNAAILAGLGRGAPRTVLVHPVLLRDRPVCVLYADNGEAPVSAGRLGDLLLLLSTAGAAFERIIRDRKQRSPRRAKAIGAGSMRAGAEAPTSTSTAAPTPTSIPTSTPDRTDGPRAAAPVPFSARPSPSETWSARVPDRARPALADDDVTDDVWKAVEPARAPTPDEILDALEVDLDEAFAGHEREEAAAEPTPAAAATPAELAERALDADRGVALAACEALAARRRDPGLRQAIDKLRRALLSGVAARTIGAAHALGALRDAEAIPLLVQVLETSDSEPAQAAASALRAITLQPLGTDARSWLGWWKENRGRGRAEWLFSGLTSADRDTRVAAAVELSQAAPPPVAYSADLPAAERESAARAWAGWWSRSGHVL
jgi:hypothetical protein